MDMRVDMVDPGQRNVMMLAVGRRALGELDLVWPVQVVDGSNLDAVRCNDVHMLGDLAADVSCGSGKAASSAVILDLDFGMAHGIANILGAIIGRFAQGELFLHPRVLSDHSLFRPFLSFDDAILEQLISGRDRAIHGLAIDLNGFTSQTNLLINWRFDYVTADPHATEAHIAFTDTKLLLVNRNDFLSSGGCGRPTWRGGRSDEDIALKSVWEAIPAGAEAAASSPG